MRESAALQRELNAFVDAGWMPGAAWRIDRGDAPSVRGACGDAAVDTVFDLASLTKMLATLPLLLIAARRRELDPDAPASRWLPELAGGPHGDVTIEQLARHQAGLPAWRPLYLEAGDLAGYVQRIAVTPAGKRGETLYSDLGFLLLGALLERACGDRLASLYVRRILEPLDGVAPRFGPFPAEAVAPTEEGNRYERALAGERGAAFDWRERTIRGAVHDVNAATLGGAAGHAGLFGDVDAVASVAAELARPRRLAFDERWHRAALDPAGAARSFGLQAARDSAAARGALPDDAVGHTGFTGTSVWIDPERRARYVLLSNRVHPRVQERGFQPVRHAFHAIASHALP